MYAFTQLDVPGARSTSATGINSAGQVVGDVDSHAFLYSGGTFTVFDAPGASLTAANAINNAGQIAGVFATSDDVDRGYITDGGRFTILSGLGTSLTYTSGINDAGVAVGYAYTGNPLSPTFNYVYSGGTYTPAPVPGDPNSEYTFVSGINNAGQIIGTYRQDGIGYGFLYSGGAFTSFAVPGAVNTSPKAINSSGQIAGFADFVGLSSRAFVYSDGLFDLFDVPGAAFGTYAYGINDAGQISGSFTGLGSHGFIVALVPEPSSLSLACIGAGIALFVSRRRRPIGLTSTAQ